MSYYVRPDFNLKTLNPYDIYQAIEQCNSKILKITYWSLGSSFIIGMIHGICEVLVVIPFYFNSSLSPAYYDKGFLQGVILLVGVGTVIHSMLDFSLSVYIWNLLPKGFVNKIGKEEKLGKVQKV